MKIKPDDSPTRTCICQSWSSIWSTDSDTGNSAHLPKHGRREVSRRSAEISEKVMWEPRVTSREDMRHQRVAMIDQGN